MPLLSTLGFNQWLNDCTQAVKTTRASFTPILGESWWSYGLVAYSMDSILLSPNPKYSNCSGSNANIFAAVGMYNMSSNHPGGANILLGDSSVLFLKDSTALATVWALGTWGRGEIISADSF